MKNKVLITALMMLLVGGFTFAQDKDEFYKWKGQKENCDMERQRGPRIPDLTEEQETKLKEIRVEFGKEVLPLQNQMKEAEAKLRTLTTVENTDINAIDKQIEKIGDIRVQMEKKQARMEQEIRKLLTEEQRLFFDTHHKHRGDGFGKHSKHGRRGGHGGHDCQKRY